MAPPSKVHVIKGHLRYMRIKLILNGCPYFMFLTMKHLGGDSMTLVIQIWKDSTHHTITPCHYAIILYPCTFIMGKDLPIICDGHCSNVGLRHTNWEHCNWYFTK